MSWWHFGKKRTWSGGGNNMQNIPREQPLTCMPQHEVEYIIKPGESYWITVDNVSIRLTRDLDGVHVTIFALGAEMHDELASAFVHHSDVIDAQRLYGVDP